MAPSRPLSDTPATGADPGADLWQRAAAFAARAHKHQFRKDGVTPYAAHPARVALTCATLFGCSDPVVLAAALLHDVIEDTGTDYDDLEKRFGSEVARCVAALSKDDRLPEPEREPAYDRRLELADWRAKLIKLADVYDNTCDRLNRLDNPDHEKLFRKCERALAIAATDTDPPPVLERAVRAVKDLLHEANPRRA